MLKLSMQICGAGVVLCGIVFAALVAFIGAGMLLEGDVAKPLAIATIAMMSLYPLIVLFGGWAMIKDATKQPAAQ